MHMPTYFTEQCLPQFVQYVSASNHFDTFFVLMEWRSASHPSLHCDLAFRSLKFDDWKIETIYLDIFVQHDFFGHAMPQCAVPRSQGWGKSDIHPGLPGHKTSAVYRFIGLSPSRFEFLLFWLRPFANATAWIARQVGNLIWNLVGTRFPETSMKSEVCMSFWFRSHSLHLFNYFLWLVR